MSSPHAELRRLIQRLRTELEWASRTGLEATFEVPEVPASDLEPEAPVPAIPVEAGRPAPPEPEREVEVSGMDEEPPPAFEPEPDEPRARVEVAGVPPSKARRRSAPGTRPWERYLDDEAPDRTPSSPRPTGEEHPPTTSRRPPGDGPTAPRWPSGDGSSPPGEGRSPPSPPGSLGEGRSSLGPTRHGERPSPSPPTAEGRSRPAGAASPEPQGAPPPSLGPAGTRSADEVALSRATSLEQVREVLGDCTRCKLHRAGRKQIVFGVGNPRAELMFVGEGPGRQEDLRGEPFVGEAGQLLTRIIENGMKVRRRDVYIANIVKCRPPGNRDPEPDEVEACEPFLRAQIAVIRPKVIVALGKYAAQTLLRTNAPIRRLRGTWHTYQGIDLMPTYHPAYLLRNPSEKRPVWEDMQAVMRHLGWDR